MPRTLPPSEKHTDIQTYLRLAKYLKPLIMPFVISIVGFGLYAYSNPLLAKLNGMIIHAIEIKDSNARWTLVIFAIGIFALRGIGSFFGTYFNTYASARIIQTLQHEVFEHVNRLPVSYFHKNSGGTVLQHITGNINIMAQALGEPVKIIFREGLTVIALLIYAFYLNWELSLVFILVAPLIAAVVTYTNKRFKDITRRNAARNANLLQAVREVIDGHEVLRAFTAQNYEKLRYGVMLDKNFKDQMRFRKVASLSTPVMQLLVAGAISGIIFLVLMPDTLAHHTTEELVGYITAVALIPKSMKQLSGVGANIQRGIVSAQLVFELLDTPTEQDIGTHDAASIQGHIVARGVCFGYNENNLVLDNITFEIKPGEMAAFVGKSGGGKSTLAKLFQRFYDPTAGSILIDGVDLRDYRLDELRQKIGLVSQNVVLFNDSIRNNIAYGVMHNASDEQVIEAARKAHALEFIEKLPQGMNTMIGDNGLQLSGGQRQRIAIARAFLKDAPILILDEATSALDNQSEQHIQQALEEIMQGRTTIVIAHRLSTIEKANKILVMSKGQIVEQGTHADLLSQKGIYQKLYTSNEL